MHRSYALFPLMLLLSSFSAAQAIPSPGQHFGFEPGKDRRLLTWKDLVGYYQLLAERSPRVSMRVAGRTTEGRPLIELVITGRPADSLGGLRGRQAALARGRLNPEELQAALEVQPVFVYVQGTLHSTEIGASCMLPHLAHWLTTSDDPDARAIREQVVLVLVPSANPDGQDLVVSWYREQMDTPWEGTSPPVLYQRYAGHDNNRDWFMLSLQETRIVSRILYERWLPEMMLDIHQMGGRGARMFVPPFSDPLNPNIPAMSSRLIDLVGTHMAVSLSANGCTGVVQDVAFDNWWDGGARSVPVRHNMIGILTETASARLASPLWLNRQDLKGHGRGMPEYRRQGSFPEPWPGGWWRLGDIVRYQQVSTVALLNLAARYRRFFVENFHAEARRQIRMGASQPPHAFVIPEDQRDRGAVRRLVKNLMQTGVEIYRARETVVADGASWPPGTWVIPCDQAFRPHIVDLLEAQDYPAIRLRRDGEVIDPYDSSGWTLPFQFGVDCHPVTRTKSKEMPLERVTRWEEKTATILPGRGKREHLLLGADSNHAFTLVNRALADGVEVKLLQRGDDHSFQFPPESANDLIRWAPDADLQIRSADGAKRDASWRLARHRVGLLQPAPASMDAGWTRLVLEEHGFEPQVVGFGGVRAGGLRRRFDTVVLADIRASTLQRGGGEGRLPPKFVRGLGVEGAQALRVFVAEGGQILSFGRSVPYVTQVLGLPVEIVTPGPAGKSEKQAVALPGSLLRARTPTGAAGESVRRNLMWAESAEQAVFVSRPRILRVKKEKRASDDPASEATVLLEYPPSDLLLSGHLRGEEHLAGRAVMMSVQCGKGRAVLYAFRPQHRSQTLGTFRLIFGALYDRTR